MSDDFSQDINKSSDGLDVTEPKVIVTSFVAENEDSSAPGFPAESRVLPEGSTSRVSGSKRSLLTHSKDGQLLSEKKLRRLEKNRLSARECRRRKREATENLEREINVLEGENLRLRLQLQIGEEAEESMQQEQEKVTEGIEGLLKSGASESEIYATIEEFKEKFADYGRDRRSAIEFHLRNIERLLMPTRTTSLAMRALRGGSQVMLDSTSQSDSYFSSVSRSETTQLPKASSNTGIVLASPGASHASYDSPILKSGNGDPNLEPKELFQYFVKYLEVTPEQAAALKDSRFVAQEMDGILMKALAVLEELRTRLAQCGEDLETEFYNIRSILTPTQAAKFLVWVANNSACMHMLNELWSRVYPQNLDQDDGPGGDSP